jgi:hypothetical protein
MEALRDVQAWPSGDAPIADYETGAGSQVSAESALSAIQTARRFVKRVAGVIPANGRTPRAPEIEPKP